MRIETQRCITWRTWVGKAPRRKRGRNDEEDPENHSTADNLSLLRSDGLAHSLAVLKRLIAVIEGDAVYCNRNPKGEPQLGRRGLYGAMGGQRTAGYHQMALLWVLNLADGEHSLLNTAERAGLPF